MQKINNKYSIIAAAVIMVVFVSLRLSSPPKNILSYDVFGYYLYLPALYIYDDPEIKDISWVNQVNEKYGASPSLYQLSKNGDQNWVIRFYAGIAIMYSPFFLAGHAAALITNYEPDGFSLPYQWAIIMAGIFYTLAAVWFLRKVLVSLFSDMVSAVTLILVFLGSNVFFFSTWGNDAPHIYILALYALVIWLTYKWHKTPKTIYAITLGLVTGVTLITRPSEVFILLVPVFWGVWNIETLVAKLKLVWERRLDVLLIILFTALAVLPQVLYWKFATGEWIYNSYDDPQSGFNFTQPRFAYILFGFRKGFYIYSPMMIFATIGFYQLYRTKRELFFPVLLFFLANIYLIACYSSLVSYGWRAFVQAHAVLAMPLACFVGMVLRQKRILKILLLALMGLVLLLNIFKSWQTHKGIIDGSRMTRTFYLDAFFATDKNNTNQSLLLVDRAEESVETLANESNYNHRVLATMDFENTGEYNKDQLDTSIVFDGKYSLRLDQKNIFSKAIEIPFKEITKNYYAWLRATVWVYKTGEPEADESLLVVHFNFEGRSYKYRAVSFKNQEIPFLAGQWNKITVDYLTPEVRTKNDPVKVYVWHRGSGEIYIDNLTLEVFDPLTDKANQ